MITNILPRFYESQCIYIRRLRCPTTASPPPRNRRKQRRVKASLSHQRSLCSRWPSVTKAFSLRRRYYSANSYVHCAVQWRCYFARGSARGSPPAGDEIPRGKDNFGDLPPHWQCVATCSLQITSAERTIPSLPGGDGSAQCGRSVIYDCLVCICGIDVCTGTQQHLHYLCVLFFHRDIEVSTHLCEKLNKNSSEDEIANVNFFYNIAHVEASAYAHWTSS